MTKQIFRAAALLALVISTGSLMASAADGEYVVSSQVVSDTASPPTSHVGDMDSGVSMSGSCADGSCASGSCGDMCGSCGGAFGRCGCGGGMGSGRLGAALDQMFPGIHGNNPGYCQPRKYDHSDLFYNYYSRGNCNRANAQMYISPQPVPPFVGHTFNTYQPLYPHEYMYWHKNRFHNYYDNGRGMNRTKVKYSAPPVRTAIKNIYWNKIRIPR